jgi:predicted lipid-binding transport protein (Tim44 family)
MYCPNCGTQTSADHNFCRACGLSLQMVSQVLAGRVPAAEPGKDVKEMAEHIQNRRRKMMRWGFITMFGGLMSGILLEVIGQAIRNFDWAIGGFIQDVSQIGALIFMLGLGFMIYSRFLPKASADPQSAQPTALPQAQPTTKLPPDRRAEPMPSVTEHTTDLLQTSEAPTPARTTARQGE